MNLSKNAVLGILQGLGLAVLSAILSYFADPSHLTAIAQNSSWIGIISAIALTLENALYDKTGKSLLGTVKL